MYRYLLRLEMAEKGLPISDELFSAIREAADISNGAFSATRYRRKITILALDPSRRSFDVEFTSRDEVPVTRSISSLTRALVKNEQQKNSGLLEGHIVNNRVFLTSLIDSGETEVSALRDTAVVGEIVQLFFGRQELTGSEKELARTACDQIREIVIHYLNEKDKL